MIPAEQHISITRHARYYTLGEAAGARDIWIVCHGYAQLARKFIDSFEVLAGPGRILVAPEGLHRFYLDPPPAPATQRRVGATWMTRADRDYDIADYIHFLDVLIEQISALAAPQARLRVLGFSQGTATVLRWAVRGARVPDDIILWAGEVPQDVDWVTGATRLGSTRFHVVRGNRDEMVPLAALKSNLGRLTDVGLEYVTHEFEGGHHLDDGVLLQLV